MRILFLTHHWNNNSHHSRHSGYQELVKYVALKHHCTVVTTGAEKQTTEEDGITVHYVPSPMKRDIFFARRLSISRFAKTIEHDFDLLHALYSDCGFFQQHPNLFSSAHIHRKVTKGISAL